MAARLTTYLVVAIVAATVIAGLMVGAQRDDYSGPIDLIIHHAKVYVADDLGATAEAVAISGNKIVRVGTERDIMRARRPQTVVIDAKGAALVPGFEDAHTSFIAGGLARDTVQLFGAATLDAVQQRVSTFAESHPDTGWISGGGWTRDVLEDAPTRGDLDEAVSDRPVALLSQDGHTLWVNTRALVEARITRRTANPANGVIVRDRRGQATGLLQDAAMALVTRAIPKAAREDRAGALQAAMRDAQAQGITTVQDLGAAMGDLDLYQAARQSEALGLRVYAAVPASTTSLDDLDAMAKRYPDDPLFKTGVAAIPLDGAVEAGSAALLSSYAGRSESALGSTALTQNRLDALVSALDAHGWQVAIDASGDRAVRMALDAFAAAARNTSRTRPRRPRIEHVDLIDPDDAARFATLGVVASIQPLHATAAPLIAWTKALGPDRAPFGWAARTLSAAGAHLAFGTDWPLLPLSPLDGIRAAVGRQAPQSAEQLTLKSAVNAWTSGAAWASFDENRKGTIKPGMLADLVLLSTDIFAGPQALADAQVELTIFDGKTVYRRKSP